MRTLNLSGFKSLDSFSISVSQGALTAGPINVPAWGGGGGSGGTITINASRSALQCAPDSVRFSVDLSASTFDTAGPTGSEVYDARLHDLIYLWDFDDTAGDWSAPVNVLAAWKDRNTAKGPWVSHVYTAPGTYNPSVLVIEPSTGKTATAILNEDDAITVLDPNDVYPGELTICVSTSGSFAGKPTGAKELTISSLLTASSEWIDEQVGTWPDNPRRWLFKRDETFTVGLAIGAFDVPGMTFGAYGTGAKPVLNSPTDGTYSYSNANFYVAGNHNGVDGTVTRDLRIFGLDMQGNHDPTTEPQSIVKTNKSSNGLWCLKHLDVVLHDCKISGKAYSCVNFNPGDTSKRAHIHIDDCFFTDFGGEFPFIQGGLYHAEASVSVTGCRLTQNPDALDDPGIRAPIRINHAAFTHIRGCDIFHTDSSQPCIKLAETAISDGTLSNVHSCSLESGLWGLAIAHNSTQGIARSSCQNVIVDGLVIVGNYGTQFSVMTKATGLTLRNCLVVQPASPNLATSDRFIAFVSAVNSPVTALSQVVGAPIRVYNNTLRMDRSNAQNNGSATKPEIIYDQNSGSYTAVTWHNNVVHMPNLTMPEDDFIPLSEVALWTPRCIGYKSNFHTAPAQTLGSAVANDASVTVAYFTSHQGALGQADFAGTAGRAYVRVFSTTYTEQSGQIEVTYGASNISVKNTSGVTWGSGLPLTLTADSGTTTDLIASYATPSGAVKDTKPLAGSDAIGTALIGNVSYMDILMQERPEPPSKGAWEAD